MRAVADGVLRRGPHARQARQPPARRPRLQRLAADAAERVRCAKSGARARCTCAATSIWRSTVKHGIDEYGDGPYGFTSPALVNTIYGRWWHPLDESAGANPVPGSPLPWTGDFLDGLGNRISMMAYANPTTSRTRRSGPTATGSCGSTSEPAR